MKWKPSNDIYVAYDTVYPTALVGEMLFAQLLVIIGHMLLWVIHV